MVVERNAASDSSFVPDRAADIVFDEALADEKDSINGFRQGDLLWP